jgi:hypothetical protein
MLGFVVVLLVAYIVYLHAKFVRKGLTQAETLTFVYEKPALSKPLQAVADRLDKWKEEGRVSREDHERLMALVREDSAQEPPKYAS